VRNKKLFYILIITFMVGIILTIAQIFSGSLVIALLFPWRLSTFLIPIAVSAIIAWSIVRNYAVITRLPENLLLVSMIIITLGVTGAGIAKFNLAYREKENSSDQAMIRSSHDGLCQCT
jgi:hypothetical protein